MTLQQLRFLIAVAESGSINAAAQRLYTAQSSISNAVKSLEQELHLEIFTRSSRGVTLTNDGTELLGYARQVVEQADMLEARYEDGGTPQARLAISAQHYAFSVEAFVNVVERWTTLTPVFCRRLLPMRARASIPYSTRRSTSSLASATRLPAARSCPLPTSHPIRATALSREPQTPSITPRNLLAISLATATYESRTAEHLLTYLSRRTVTPCRPVSSPMKCNGVWHRSR